MGAYEPCYLVDQGSSLAYGPHPCENHTAAPQFFPEKKTYVLLRLYNNVQKVPPPPPPPEQRNMAPYSILLAGISAQRRSDGNGDGGGSDGDGGGSDGDGDGSDGDGSDGDGSDGGGMFFMSAI